MPRCHPFPPSLTLNTVANAARHACDQVSATVQAGAAGSGVLRVRLGSGAQAQGASRHPGVLAAGGAVIILVIP